MQLNPFIWNNYKQTEQGKKAIEIFSGTDTGLIISTYAKNLPTDNETAAGFIDDLTAFRTAPVLPDQLDFERARTLLENLADQGVLLTYEDSKSEEFSPSSYNFLQLIPILSTWLYYNYPDIFKPYFFKNNFDLLTRIADTFGIVMPPVPLKRYKRERFLYYGALCQAFAEFEQANNLTAAEFCAFIYDFAPAYLQQTVDQESDLPQPTQVWWIGGDKGGGDFRFLDNATTESTSFWQGAEDTRKGDILIMYCLSPRSYIHSVWRATRDGIADPFFHYYSNIYIGHGQKVPPISIHELKADDHFSQNPLVRKNLQGINGYPLTSDDYLRLQQMFAAKGFDTGVLPQLYRHAYAQNKDLQNEREVEVHLIEPLIERLGYSTKDWVRQLPVRMGRGERNFPDYVFLSDITAGFEKASMLIESKFCIKNNRELEDTFKQVWSYGQRLGAGKLVIADKDALWIYARKHDAFDRTAYTKLFWKELENPDSFNLLKKLIGKR